MSWALEIEKPDIRKAKILNIETGEIGDGEARLAVERFALTANNITYAAFGEIMRYWEFFPAVEQGHGRLPVWGFAVVAESRYPGLEAGERIYGYFPAASDLIVRPGQLSPAGFVDVSPHRAELAAPYNRYVRCAGDAGYDAGLESERMVLQPLFLTGWLLARHVNEENAFGANRIFLTSASSKTAIGMAKCLKDENRSGLSIVGLTSPSSRDFVEGLGFYDAVVTYPEIDSLPRGDAALIVDFAGDSGINHSLHTRLETDLKANIRVGGAHWEKSAPTGDLPGPNPVFFFAPDHVQRVIGELGPDGFQKAYGQSWKDFAEGARSWLEFRSFSGPQACLEIYQKLIAGDPMARDGLTIEA